MTAASELTLRERPAGGAVLPAVRETSPPFPEGRRRVVLLVHGYNDTEDAARRAYAAFTAKVAGLGPAAQALLADVWKLYWPGDAALGPLSFLSYPLEIAPATESAEKLAVYLRTLSGPGGTPTELVFVCHSLGNRLLLEVLDRLAADPAPLGHVGAVVLMAAAVPVGMVDDGGALRPGAALPGASLALYSRDDMVLHWAFPLGETVAGEGLFPTAVGRFGQPPGAWTERRELAGDGHGDYWGDPRAARLVARRLGAAVPWETATAGVAARALPPANEVPGREVEARALQSP